MYIILDCKCVQIYKSCNSLPVNKKWFFSQLSIIICLNFPFSLCGYFVAVMNVTTVCGVKSP